MLADRVEGEVGEVTFLLQGHNADGHGGWTCRDGEAVFTRPGARLHVFFLESVTACTVHAGTFEAEQRGLLRLEAPVSGGEVTAVLVPCPSEEDPPACAREPGALVVAWRGRQWRVERRPHAVALDGREFSL